MDRTILALQFLKYIQLIPEKTGAILSLLQNFETVGWVRTTLWPGKSIQRSRANEPSQVFSRISELSYKPAVFNFEYQRASTPKNTMFYGSIVSEKAAEGELKYPRIINLYEMLPWLRDKRISRTQLVTVSNWRVMKPLHFVSLVHYRGFKRHNSFASEQREYFERFTRRLEPTLANRTRLVTEYLSEQFAKENIHSQFDYMVSALFTELITKNPAIAGVIYPSVRTGGEGFNVAIHPRFIPSHIEPINVAEMLVDKQGTDITITNERGCFLWDAYSDFEMRVLPDELRGRPT